MFKAGNSGSELLGFNHKRKGPRRHNNSQSSIPVVKVVEFLDDRILNDIDMVTQDNDFLNRIEKEDNEVSEKKSGFLSENRRYAPSINISSHRKEPSFDSKINGPHENGGCQDISLITIPDMLKYDSERSQMLINIYKDPKTKSQNIRKLVNS